MTAASYPLFQPPAHLAGKAAHSWTSDEARQYFDWLTGVLNRRAQALLEYLDVEWMADHRQLLDGVGEKAVHLLVLAEFSEDRQAGPRLTNSGYALAADIGLLLARCLLAESPEAVRWEILRRPKSDVSFNLPVLTGFGGLALDPIQVSVAQSYGVLRGERDAHAWSSAHAWWRTRAGVARLGPSPEVIKEGTPRHD